MSAETEAMAAAGDQRREAGRAAFKAANTADFVAHDAAHGSGQVGDARAHLAAVDRQLAQHLLPERIRQTLLAQKEKLLRAIHDEPATKTDAQARTVPKYPAHILMPLRAFERRRRQGR